MHLVNLNGKIKSRAAIYLVILTGIIFAIQIACKKELQEEIPSLVTINVTDITATTFTSGGLVFSAGGDSVLSRGICLSTNKNPVITDTRTVDGTGKGSFTSTISGLMAGTTYYIRAYATNNAGTGYGNQFVITTMTESITITTTPVSSVTSTSAQSGGNITSDGGSAVNDRGVCWSTTTGPTIADNITTDGTGSGAFTSILASLTPGTTYYVRAYATNSTGTAYGNEVTFETGCNLPAAPGVITGNTEVAGNATGVAYTISAVTGATGYTWTVPAGATIVSGQGTTAILVDFGTTGGNVSVRSENSCGNSIYTTLNVTMIISDCGTISDIEGNVYNTVTIGTQCWMSENLKTTKYNNGDQILTETDDYAWSTLSTGAYCWYDNDATAYRTVYGALYNWYAVDDSRNLCPTGWHVPTNAEWTILEDFLVTNGFNYDGSASGNKFAIALATSSGWNSSATEGAVGNTDYPEKRNSTGFTALPGGVRDANQLIFGSIGNYGMWWTSSENGSTEAWDRGIASGYSSLGRLNVLKTHGFSIRCLKN